MYTGKHDFKKSVRENKSREKIKAVLRKSLKKDDK